MFLSYVNLWLCLKSFWILVQIVISISLRWVKPMKMPFKLHTFFFWIWSVNIYIYCANGNSLPVCSIQNIKLNKLRLYYHLFPFSRVSFPALSYDFSSKLLFLIWMLLYMRFLPLLFVCAQTLHTKYIADLFGPNTKISNRVSNCAKV